MPPKERLHYFDVLKGIAIYMVVMGHVLCLCMSDMDNSVPFRLIGSIHMPLFFFISGWFSYKLLPDGRVARPDLRRRFVQLMLPTAVVGSLYILVYNHLGLYRHEETSLGWFWLSAGKQGYWFTVSLFEIMVIYAATAGLLHRLHRTPLSIAAALVLSVAIVAAGKLFPAIDKPLQLNATGCYTFPFLIGVIARRHKDGFARLLHSDVAMTLAIIVLAGCLTVNVQYRHLGNAVLFVSRLVSHIPLAMIAIAVIRPWTDASYGRPDGPSAAVRVWVYLGRNSLGIYLLHYFMLFPMQTAETWLRPMLPGFVPVALTAAVAAAAVVGCTCMVIELLKPSRILTRLFTGT